MPVYYWLILAAILVIIELFTAGFFIACFALGALVAAVVTQFTPSFEWQAAVFVVISVIAIPFSRLFARRFSDDNIPQAGADAMIGRTAVVINDIIPNSEKGQIRIEGEAWRAFASVEIKKGETVKLIDVKGTMFEVEKIEGSQ